MIIKMIAYNIDRKIILSFLIIAGFHESPNKIILKTPALFDYMAKIIQNIKSFYLKCKRVWHVLKKPSKEEFLSISKISAIGILILGFFGFLISIIINLFF